MSSLGISKVVDGYTYFELVYTGGISIAVVTALVQIRTVYDIVIKKNESLVRPILGNYAIITLIYYHFDNLLIRFTTFYGFLS